MEKKSKKKRQIQAEETYRKLLTVVYELMDKKSYHEISVDEICAEAGVSKGTFYHYFESKQEILTHLSRQASTEILESMTFNPQKSARDMFDAYIDTIVEATEKATSAGEARMLIALLTSGASESYKEIEPQMQYVLKILKHGRQRGELSEKIDLEAINDLIRYAIQGAVTLWTIEKGGFDLKERLEYIFSPLWK